MERKLTYRGFRYYEFKDFYNKKCTLQKSSIVEPDCIWLGIDDAKPKILPSRAIKYGIKREETTGWIDYLIPEDVSLNTRMHLNREQVKELIPILQKFVNTGDVE